MKQKFYQADATDRNMAWQKWNLLMGAASYLFLVRPRYAPRSGI